MKKTNEDPRIELKNKIDNKIYSLRQDIEHGLTSLSESARMESQIDILRWVLKVLEKA